jgi:lysophospholipase L1-like esterase
VSGIAARIAIQLIVCALVALQLSSCRCAEDPVPSNVGGGVRASTPSDTRPGMIVVLGSSTAAGIGPSDPKNAWVSRYRAHLAERFPNFKLTNLAVGGQTTYHVQATGFTPPAGRPSPTAGKNISAALAHVPDAIIVNLPSNDAAANISLSEQLANYERVAAQAGAAKVLLWVTTSQPRNFESHAQRLLLVQARDAIQRRFAPRALDFWTPFAEPSGEIESEADSGDGTHLNDAAHATLAGIVVAARIPEAVLAARSREVVVP